MASALGYVNIGSVLCRITKLYSTTRSNLNTLNYQYICKVSTSFSPTKLYGLFIYNLYKLRGINNVGLLLAAYAPIYIVFIALRCDMSFLPNIVLYVYITYSLFMFVTLFILLVSYTHLGYLNTNKLFMTAYLYFLPIIVSVMLLSFTTDFDINVSIRAYSVFSNQKYSFVSFRFDNLSVIFSSTTYIIGFFTGTFQFMYMSDDLKKGRFFFLINYFIFSMFTFVHAGNFIILIMGWELLGITSFFLISHYDMRYLTIKASLKVFTFNRLSDSFMFLAVIFSFFDRGDFGFGYSNSFFGDINLVRCFVLLMLSLASFTKSAQLFFFFWLPDSMEAPIPASALIHSATLVSAGIYMLLRFRMGIVLCPLLCSFILSVSLITIVCVTPLIFMQTDLKRLLALSTIVNISFMYVLIILLNTKYVCMYFILHGLFKSCSFLILGMLIVVNNHSQDYRYFSTTISNPLYVGFLFSICVIFLSGINVTASYSIKHLALDRSSYIYNSVYLNDVVFILYSSFSALYGAKVFYFVIIRGVRNSVLSTHRFSTKNVMYLTHVNNVISLYLLLSIFSVFLIHSIVFSDSIIYLPNYVCTDVISYLGLNTSVMLPILNPVIYVIFNNKRYFNVIFLYTVLFVFCLLI